MAEADVDIRPSSPRFFCHKCNQDISHVLDDFTCPTCKSGFIEEVLQGASPAQQGTNMDTIFGLGTGSDPNEFAGPLDFMNVMLRGFSDGRAPGSGGGSVSFSGLGGQRGPRGNTPAHPRSAADAGGQSPGGSHHFSFVINASPRQGGPAQGQGGQVHQHPSMENPMENMLYTFLTDLIQGLGGGGAAGGPGGLPILSNLGDYVWGREGLDAIVTQLMNQMEGTGPPPLSTDKLEKLPSVRVTKDQIDRKLQCSVCWDDFKLNEEVKQLECDHVYHPECIIPWLKLHGTCPICRKDLTNQCGSGGGQDDGGASSPSFGTRDDSSSSTSGMGSGSSGNNGGNTRNPFATSTSSSTASPDDHSNNSSNSSSNNTHYVGRGRGRQQGSNPPQQGQRPPGSGGNLDLMDFEFD